MCIDTFVCRVLCNGDIGVTASGKMLYLDCANN